MAPPDRESGFTLVELMISLALFALVALAGVALVDSVVGVQGGTAERLARLDEMERAMLIVTSDLEQVTEGPVLGGGPAVAFRRSSPAFGGAAVPVSYRFAGGRLLRRAGGRDQVVITRLHWARWRFLGAGWADRWPVTPGAASWPRAVMLEMQLAPPGPAGTLRRVVALPAYPNPPRPAVIL